MSYVAGVIIWASTTDDTEDNPAVLQHINSWLDAHGHGPMTEIPASLAGGKKHPQATWYAGGHNYLNIPRFLDAVWAAPWEYPENVCVIVEDENDDTATLYRHPAFTAKPPVHEDWEHDEPVEAE